jgi:hypothetical protein
MGSGEYDEESVLTDYLWRQRHELLTDFERKCFDAGLVRQKWAGVETEEAKSWLEQEGLLQDSAVNQALSDGLDSLVAQVRARLIRDHGNAVNRCLQCERIVASPQALFPPSLRGGVSSRRPAPRGPRPRGPAA